MPLEAIFGTLAGDCHNAPIVDQNVQPAMFRQKPLSECLHRSQIGEIQPMQDDLPARILAANLI